MIESQFKSHCYQYQSQLLLPSSQFSTHNYTKKWNSQSLSPSYLPAVRVLDLANCDQYWFFHWLVVALSVAAPVPVAGVTGVDIPVVSFFLLHMYWSWSIYFVGTRSRSSARLRAVLLPVSLDHRRTHPRAILGSNTSLESSFLSFITTGSLHLLRLHIGRTFHFHFLRP